MGVVTSKYSLSFLVCSFTFPAYANENLILSKNGTCCRSVLSRYLPRVSSGRRMKNGRWAALSGAVAALFVDDQVPQSVQKVGLPKANHLNENTNTQSYLPPRRHHPKEVRLNQ